MKIWIYQSASWFRRVYVPPTGSFWSVGIHEKYSTNFSNAYDNSPHYPINVYPPLICEAKDEGISDGAGPVYAAAMTLEFQQPPYKVVPPQFIS